MKLIMNGNVDGAFAKVHEWYPQIVEVGSQLCIYLLHYYGCYKFELIFKLSLDCFYFVGLHCFEGI